MAWLSKPGLAEKAATSPTDGIRVAGKTRRDAEYNHQFQCLPGRLHEKAWRGASRTAECAPPGRLENHHKQLPGEFASWAAVGWNLTTHDVVVSWSAAPSEGNGWASQPGPSRNELKDWCSDAGRVRFVIVKGPYKDLVQHDAAVRFATVAEAKRAAKELDNQRWPRGSKFPFGTPLSVRWALAEEAWGGRPSKYEADFVDMASWKFNEYEAKPEEDGKAVMKAWPTEYGEKELVRRHGMPALGWDHDQVSRLDLRSVAGHEAFVRANTDNPVYGPGPVDGQRPGGARPTFGYGMPARMAPEGHPRLRKNDGGGMCNLPYESRGEDELQLWWDLEIS